MNKIFSLILIILLMLSCSGRDDSEDPLQPLVFSSLEAEKDTIESGESTRITAVATGYRITYNWSATAGDILGRGNQVVYAASPCQAGKNKITCTVKDANNASLSKEVYIVVK